MNCLGNGYGLGQGIQDLKINNWSFVIVTIAHKNLYTWEMVRNYQIEIMSFFDPWRGGQNEGEMVCRNSESDEKSSKSGKT